MYGKVSVSARGLVVFLMMLIGCCRIIICIALQVALLERLAVEQGLTGMEALTVDKSQVHAYLTYMS